jgi:ribosomal protein S18 acetylase RimI-like enzyme
MNWRLIRDEGHRNPMGVTELEGRMDAWLRGDHRAAVFETNGQLVGYALYRFDVEHVYLRHFYVEPSHRRQGVGRSALIWLRREVWAGARVRVEVLVTNDVGMAFWRGIGFRDYSLTLEADPVARAAEGA